MLILDEARKLQAKYQRNAILKFSVISILILTVMFMLIEKTGERATLARSFSRTLTVKSRT